ncbi:MAG: Fmu (Sun) domain-containing protein [Bacteroidetes bacterium]|nr:Fmu (Sun) domain-containing protein [Bacteroidota bacterium]MBS1930147.1 Fmu (Sun) domain-containing protein [Bacteroidota bacterium]
MTRYQSYLNSAAAILSIYNGEEPFAAFLKKYFAQYKKFGSKDRKHISQLCYCFFRTAMPREGEKNSALEIEGEIMRGLFLCSKEENEILKALNPEWYENATLSIREKIALLGSQYSISKLFPWEKELSKGIDYENFCESFLIQPDLFIRLRSGHEQKVIEKLGKTGINFKKISDTCLALDNASKIDSIIELDYEAVIQDYNSQQTGNIIQSEIANNNFKNRVWDCCAGSGGKSLMLHDINPTIQLIVTDKRENILANLKKRFEKAGIRNYKMFLTDLASGKPGIRNLKSEIILADVPCTGSGTWSRTPEQLYFFEPGKTDEYANLQKKIISSVIPHLQPEGYLIYITCSVFKKENEEAVAFIQDHYKLVLLRMELLKGYEIKADSMFIAIFKKPLQGK